MGFLVTVAMVIYMLAVCKTDSIRTRRYNKNIEEEFKENHELMESLFSLEKEKEIDRMLSAAATDKEINRNIERRLNIIFLNIPELSGLEDGWDMNRRLVKTLICASNGFMPYNYSNRLNINRYMVSYYPSAKYLDCNIQEYEKHIVNWIEKELNLYGHNVEIFKEGLQYTIKRRRTGS